MKISNEHFGKEVDFEQWELWAMISFDRGWLERVRGSKRSIYGKIPLEERAGALHEILQAYLGVPVRLEIGNIPRYPWITLSHRVAGTDKWRRDLPVGYREDLFSDFEMRLSPKFLKIEKEEDALVLVDFLIFGDLKSRKRFMDVFSGPQFQLSSGMRSGRRPLSPVGKVHNLQILGREIERIHFKLKTIPLFVWDSRRYARLGCYDKSRDLIRVNPFLDHPDVPSYVLEKILFHELLHAFFKEGVCRPNCVFEEAIRDYENFLSDLYPPHIAEELFVRRAEKRYEHYEKAQAWLSSNWGNHVLKFPRKPRRSRNMIEVFLPEPGTVMN